MTPEERYLFDLQGYLVVGQAISADLLGRLNETVDEAEKLTDEQAASQGIGRQYVEAGDVYAQLGKPSDSGPGDYMTPALPFGGPFEELIDLPTTVPLVEEMIGDASRLDAAAFLTRHHHGAFRFHHGYAELLPYSEYHFDRGTFKCVSVKISYALTDVAVEDGCFAVIPGSHKSNFTNPLVGQIPNADHPLVEAVPCRAGDAVIFSEDLSHGAVENRGRKVRRTLFYSYAPAFQCSWSGFVDTAPGFSERASSRRRQLVDGPPPYIVEVVDV